MPMPSVDPTPPAFPSEFRAAVPGGSYLAISSLRLPGPELPELRAPLERVASLTVGINLDLELRPISAVLLDINDHKVNAPHSWLERVIGAPNGDGDETGVAPLHMTPEEIRWLAGAE